MPPDKCPDAPARRAGSIRRTIHLDALRRDASVPPQLRRIAGAGRVLLTSEDATTVLDTASLAVEIGPSGTVADVAADPAPGGLSGLIGLPVGFGFRSLAKAVLTELEGSLLGALIDDLSGGAAPSGYGAIREAMSSPSSGRGVPLKVTNQVDVCAGWREGGLPIRRRRDGGELPFDPDPPVASPPNRSDRWAWHDMAPLAARSSRRLRRLDVWLEDQKVFVDTMFRDTTADPDLTERIVHEYRVSATLDRATFEVLGVEALPGTLPFPEDCPLAASSAALIVGARAEELRAVVRERSRGPVSCTHLNDVFRSLADLPGLLRRLQIRADRDG